MWNTEVALLRNSRKILKSFRYNLLKVTFLYSGKVAWNTHLLIMESRAFCLLMFCCFINVCNLHPLNLHPSNGLRLCRKNSSLSALEVLPGGGWDNLRNIDMGRVMNLSYSQCQTTEDGVYLIPDEVFVIPQKVSGVETNSEIISTWLEQKSSTSSSINADVSFYSVLNAKFSTENQRMKTHQVKDSSVTARVQVGTKVILRVLCSTI